MRTARDASGAATACVNVPKVIHNYVPFYSYGDIEWDNCGKSGNNIVITLSNKQP